MNLKDIKISIKLAIGFSVVLMMLVVGTAIGIGSNWMLLEASFDIEKYGVQQKTLQRFLYLETKANLLLMDVIIEAREGGVSPEKLKQFEDLKKDLSKKAEFIKTINQTAEKEKISKKLVQDFSAFLGKAENRLIPQAVNSPDDHQALATLYQEFDALGSKIEQLTNELNSLLVKNVKSKKRERNELAGEVKWFMLGALAFALAAGGIFSYTISKMIIGPITQTREMLDNIAEGDRDLTARLPVDSKNEMGQLAASFNKFVSNLQITFKEVIENTSEMFNSCDIVKENTQTIQKSSQAVNEQSHVIGSTAEKVATNVRIVTDGAEQASANLISITASVEELSANFNTVAAATEEASSNMSSMTSNIESISMDIGNVSAAIEEMSSTMADITDKTKEAMDLSTTADESSQETFAVMNELGDLASKIGQVTKLISSIASQTNMLALNATIEAANAGEAGKGFAVVATEVKELAQQTAEANSQIAKQIDQIQGRTSNAVQNTESTGKIIQKLNEINQSINIAVEEQNRATNEISSSVDSIAAASNESSMAVRESSEGLDEITRSVAEASEAAKESAKNVTAGSKGVQDIASSSIELSSGVQEVNHSLSDIRQLIQKVEGGVNNSLEKSEKLSSLASRLKEMMSSFKV